jgi:hypothetical protein
VRVTAAPDPLRAAEVAFAALPFDLAEIFVRRHCVPSAMRRRRLDERDASASCAALGRRVRPTCLSYG